MVTELDQTDVTDVKSVKPTRFSGLSRFLTASQPADVVAENPAQSTPVAPPKKKRKGIVRSILQWITATAFSSLLRQIIVLNLVALIVLVSGIQLSNKFRKGLIEARVESLLTQGRIIAGALSASADVERDAITIDPEKLLALQVGGPDGTILPEIESLDFPIDPQKVAPVLRQLIEPTKLRARIYDRSGELIVDSKFLYRGGDILRFNLPSLNPEPEPFWDRIGSFLHNSFQRTSFPTYQDHGGKNGRNYPEVELALKGSDSSVVRVREEGELIVSVAVPVQRYRAVLGSLLLSTEGDDIDETVRSESMAIFRVFLVAAAVTIILSIVLWAMIASPLRRLANAADTVRTTGSKARRTKIPHFGSRSDEIGELSKSIRDMTDALYERIDAIGNFAADVSHELKNPLTSLRSAVETMPLAKSEENREKLLKIIHHDVLRLDRLITDISDASRLDAELAREQADPVSIRKLLTSLISFTNEVHGDQVMVELILPPLKTGPLQIEGHDGRIGQVINNLIDNARSFVPKEGGKIVVSAAKDERDIVIKVEDNGPGIDSAAITQIFRRFYTDRPEHESFGDNSGLGLSITQQIVEAHNGTIHAENIMGHDSNGVEVRAGARFVVRLPAS